jgi:hypothetical protein
MSINEIDVCQAFQKILALSSNGNKNSSGNRPVHVGRRQIQAEWLDKIYESQL